MRRWDCRIEIVRETVVEAEDADRARGLALSWFFDECMHAIDERDVAVDPIEEGE